MSFPRHREIFPSDGGAGRAANAPAHRLDEFPAGYSSAGCSPAVPASASPTGFEYAVLPSCRSRNIHRTANCVLTVCVSRGGKRSSGTRISCGQLIGQRHPPAFGVHSAPSEDRRHHSKRKRGTLRASYSARHRCMEISLPIAHNILRSR